MAEHDESDRDSHTQIYSRIKEAIVFSRIAPGVQINIHRLGTQFGVSDTPAREALIRLAHEELIDYFPNRGFFTKPMKVAKFADHYEMAFVLLKHAIHSGPSSFTIEGLRPPPLFGGPPSGGEAETTRVHALFIESLYERIAFLSGNSVLVSGIRRFNDYTTFIRELDLERAEATQEIGHDMTRLIKVLAAGDRSAAIENLAGQFARKKALLTELVKEGNNRALSAFQS